MEPLAKQIQTFLSIGVGSGDGMGYGDGMGDGIGYGGGIGSGHGNCHGGMGDGSGNGGGGDGIGGGNGMGGGKGYGGGSGSGHGYGNGIGDDSGSGIGLGIAEIEGHKVYDVDDIPTIITAVHGNVAQGYLLLHNTCLVPCYIVKEANKFARGATLREAYTALIEKLYDGSAEEEHIAAFIKQMEARIKYFEQNQI